MSRDSSVWFCTTPNIVLTMNTENGEYLSPTYPNVTDCVGEVPLASVPITSVSCDSYHSNPTNPLQSQSNFPYTSYQEYFEPCVMGLVT